MSRRPSRCPRPGRPPAVPGGPIGDLPTVPVTSREMQYLHAHRQVEDLARLRDLWRQARERETLTQRLPWLVRLLCAAGALLWLAGAALLLNLTVGIVGCGLILAACAAAEWHWRLPGRGGSFAWELDRLNPQFEGAFSLLDWLDAGDGPERGPRQAALDVTLARVDWQRELSTPDRREERRRVTRQLALLSVLLALGVALGWLWRPAANPPPPGSDTRLATSPTPAVAPPNLSAGIPQISDLTVRVEPPAYTGLPVQETHLPTIQAPVGSRVTVRWRARCDRPTELQTWVQMGERRLTAPTGGGAPEWQIAANVPSGEAAIEARAGAQTARLPLYLTWRDDRPPSVQANVPAKIERDQNGIRVELHVEDDYGLSKIELLISTQSPPGAPTTRVESILLPITSGQDSFHGPVLIPGAILDALHQDRLRLQLKAWDGRTDENGRPQPNLGATDPADFLVIQPWDNARKPRSLDRRQGSDGDQPQHGDNNSSGNGGGGGGQGNDGPAPKLLQKDGNAPPGSNPAQSPGSDQDPAKYSNMAGSQGDADQQQSDQQKQNNTGGPSDSGNGSGSNTPPQPPPSQPPPPQPNAQNPEGNQGAGNGNSTPDTDGVKHNEPLTGDPGPQPPPSGQPNPANPGGSSSSPENGSPQTPPPPTSDPNNPGGKTPTPPPATSEPQPSPTPPPGGAAGGSHPESRARPAGSQQTDPNARGNAAADAGVTGRVTASVDEALQYAREKPLGGWQRDSGGRQVADRVVQSDGSSSGGNLVTTPGAATQTAVDAAHGRVGATEDNLAAERADLAARHAARVEQYLLRLRREQPSPTDAAPRP